jgi:hypothetical protein
LHCKLNGQNIARQRLSKHVKTHAKLKYKYLLLVAGQQTAYQWIRWIGITWLVFYAISAETVAMQRFSEVVATIERSFLCRPCGGCINVLAHYSSFVSVKFSSDAPDTMLSVYCDMLCGRPNWNTHCQATDRIMYPRIQLNCFQQFCRQGSLATATIGVLLQLGNGL